MISVAPYSLASAAQLGGCRWRTACRCPGVRPRPRPSAHRADAEDHHVVAVLDLGVLYRVEAGGHHIRGHQRVFSLNHASCPKKHNANWKSPEKKSQSIPARDHCLLRSVRSQSSVSLNSMLNKSFVLSLLQPGAVRPHHSADWDPDSHTESLTPADACSPVILRTGPSLRCRCFRSLRSRASSDNTPRPIP